jgi:hypothetical protein
MKDMVTDKLALLVVLPVAFVFALVQGLARLLRLL